MSRVFIAINLIKCFYHNWLAIVDYILSEIETSFFDYKYPIMFGPTFNVTLSNIKH